MTYIQEEIWQNRHTDGTNLELLHKHYIYDKCVEISIEKYEYNC